MIEEKIGLNRNFVGYIRELKGYSKGRGLQSTEILVYGLWQAIKIVTKYLQEILTAASTQSNNLKGVDKKDYIANLPKTNEKFRVFST